MILLLILFPCIYFPPFCINRTVRNSPEYSAADYYKSSIQYHKSYSNMPHSVTPSIEPDSLKIAILGAAGGIGQSLSLLLKAQLQYQLKESNRSVTHIHLALYDVNQEAINGVTADLSHIDTPISVSSHSPAGGIENCLHNASIVVIPAGVPRKPGMTRDDLFNVNAGIISQLGDSIAECCDLSKVFVLVISNPVNSLVPVMVSNILKNHPQSRNSGIERRIMGVTKLDIVRASTFLREINIESGLTPRVNSMPDVPVIGGHSGETITPLFSQSNFLSRLNEDQLKYLIHRVQYGGDEVVKAKNGKGSATLSMAHAGYKCVVQFVSLLLGNIEQIHGTYYVPLKDANNFPIAPGADQLLPLVDGADYFAIPLTITTKGVSYVDYDIVNRMNDMERNQMLPICVSQLKKNIDKGLEFVASRSASP